MHGSSGGSDPPAPPGGATASASSTAQPPAWQDPGDTLPSIQIAIRNVFMTPPRKQRDDADIPIGSSTGSSLNTPVNVPASPASTVRYPDQTRSVRFSMMMTSLRTHFLNLNFQSLLAGSGPSLLRSKHPLSLRVVISDRSQTQLHTTPDLNDVRREHRSQTMRRVFLWRNQTTSLPT